MKKPKSKPGPKPVTVSLHPLKAEDALRAFMAVDPKKLKKRFRAFKARKR
jgi:hypothetical protein